tara:strand:- start:37 stop:624 length:588 start_codon:yes stop_codon:yes gene_type:complete
MISLGNTCAVAYQMKKFNVRTQAYPFDWLRVDKLSHINRLLEDRFEIDSFLDVTEISRSDKFPIRGKNGISIIMQNKYNMKFYHDFSLNYNMDDIKTKYTRRRDRFMNYIKTNNKICFIRDELNMNRLNLDDIEKFINIIQGMNKNIEINLIIIVHNPKSKPLKYETSGNIQIVNDIQPFGDWTRPNVDWKEIFN